MPFIGVQPASALLTSADIQDGQITTAKIANDAVDNTKLDLTSSYDFSAGLTLGDNLTFDVAGKGVHLGVTSATASNLMDDYEEGTWTPGISYTGGQTATMNQTSGVYTKVGRIVHCTGMLSILNKNSGSGDANLTGLPFTVADSVSHTSLEGNGVIGYYATLSANVFTMTLTPVNSDTKCELYTGASGTTSTRATVSHFENNAQIRFSFNYAV